MNKSKNSLGILEQSPPQIPEDFDATEYKQHIRIMRDIEFLQAHNDFFREVGFFDYTLTSFEHFKDWIKGSFLEVGCASGRTLKAVKTFCDVDQCVGIDISHVALKAAEHDVVLADVEKGLPFRDAIFDTVLCGHVLEHLRDPKQALIEIQRVCRDRIIILVPLQNESQRWKKTNWHIQFWPTIESFERFYGEKAEIALSVRDDSLAIMLFRKK